jgi:hypothetical protein
MPADNRISQLLEALKGDLYQDKLESLVREFEALAQDRGETLVFFVLKNVCQRLADALEGEAVTAERFYELTTGIGEQISDILQHLHEGTDVAKLNILVATLYRNLGLYRR